MTRSAIRRALAALVPTLGLVVVLVAAAGLRLVGTAFDQPYVYYPDEFAIAKPAMNMVATGSVNPHAFAYPSFIVYAETGVVQVVHFITGASLDTSGATQFGGLPGQSRSDFETAQYLYVLWGRVLVGFLGVLTVLLLALAGRVSPFSSRRTRVEVSGTPQDPPADQHRDLELGWLAGLVGAGFFAFAVLPLDYSRFVGPDVPSALFTTAALVAALAAVARPPDRASNRLLVLSGLFVGVAASTKYPAAAAALVPAIAYMTRAGSLRALPRWLPGAIHARTPYLVGLAAIGAFIAITPMILFDTRAVIKDAMSEVIHYTVSGHPGAEGSSGAYYLNYLWTTGFGPVLSVLALCGIGWAIARHRASDLVLLTFPLVDFLLLSITKVHFERNLLPLVPFVALLAGRFVAESMGMLVALLGRHRPALGIAAAIVLLAAMAVQPVGAAVTDAQTTSLPRTETAALNWVNDHLPAGSAIVREEYTPQLDPGRYQVGYTWTLSDNDLGWYRSHGFRYAIVSSRMYARYLNSDYPTESSFYAGLFALPTVYKVAPSSTLNGPTIVILDLQPAP